MKSKIHPEYMETIVICSCGETFKTRSTKPEIKVEICSKCHPFFTGKQKLIDSGGRVQRFQTRYDYTIDEDEKLNVSEEEESSHQESIVSEGKEEKEEDRKDEAESEGETKE